MSDLLGDNCQRSGTLCRAKLRYKAAGGKGSGDCLVAGGESGSGSVSISMQSSSITASKVNTTSPCDAPNIYVSEGCL